jgi:hypothetical protein
LDGHAAQLEGFRTQREAENTGNTAAKAYDTADEDDFTEYFSNFRQSLNGI